MRRGLIAVLLFVLACPPAAEATNFLPPRAKPPAGFKRMPWPEKRKVLFGLFGPNEKERGLMDAAMPTCVEPPADPPRVMLYYRCKYPHVSIATGVYALEKLAEATGAFEVVSTDDPADFNPGKLAEFDAVVLINTTTYNEAIGVTGQAALMGYLADGHGLIGIHAAADSSYGWRAGAETIGGLFAGHPWLPNKEWALRLESPGHPLNAAFEGKGLWLKDEIYIYRPGSFSRARSRVLLSLDTGQEFNFDKKNIPERMHDKADPKGDYPVAWIHEREGGRVFYSNLGHNASTYREPAVLRHYLDGILYATGRIEADATPSAELADVDYAGAPDR